MPNFWEEDEIVSAPEGGSGPRPVFTVPDPQGDDERRYDRGRDARQDQQSARDAARSDGHLSVAQSSESRSASSEIFDREIAIGDKFNALQEVKDYRAALPYLMTGLQTAPNGAGDSTLVTSYARVMDPGGVVNEGERQAATGTGSFVQQRVAEFKNIISNNGSLTPEIREQLRTEMNRKVAQNRKLYNAARSRYATIAERNQFDPALVLGEDDALPFLEDYRRLRERPSEDAPRALTTEEAIRNGADVQFGMDKLGGDQVFDRSEYLKDQYGISGSDEARLAASLEQLMGRPDLSATQVAALYGQLGIALPSDEDLNALTEELRAGVPGSEVSGFDTSDAETAYIDQLRALNAQNDPDGYGAPELAAQGAAWGFADEALGVAEGVKALATGGSPVAAYGARRDAERLALEEARAGGGMGATVAEIAGGLATGGVRLAPSVARTVARAQGVGRIGTARAGMRANSAAKEGAVAGATAGFGYGEGAGDSALNAGAGAAGGYALGRVLDKAGNWLGRRRETRAREEATSNDNPSQPTPAPTSPTVPPEGRPASDLDFNASTDGTAEIARNAIRGGTAGRAARRQLAMDARTNPDARAAAERLGIELPADVVSDNAQVQSLVGLARSQVGSNAEAGWRSTVASVAQRADEALEALGGSGDLAQVSDDVLTRLRSTADSLERQASELRANVNDAIIPSERVDTPNLQAILAETIQDYGGIDEAKAAMSAQERSLLKMLGEGEEAIRPTYARLNRIRDDIGQALHKRTGPWADVNERQLTRLYRALADDQIDAVEQLGGAEVAEQQRAANSLFSRMFDQRAEIQNLFGTDLNKSLAPALRRALVAGGKGDASHIRGLLSRVPEDMRSTALTSALFAEARTRAAHGGFSFANYAKTYQKMRENAPIYSAFSQAVGPEASRILRDLYIVSRRMNTAENYVLKTGKSTQGLQNAVEAESILARVFGDVRERGTTAIGAGVGGVVGGPIGAAGGASLANNISMTIGKAGASRLDKLDDLLRSPEFGQALQDVASGKAPDEALAALDGSKAFRSLARSLGYLRPADRKAWLASLSVRPIAASTPIREAGSLVEAGTTRAAAQQDERSDADSTRTRSETR